MAKKVRCAETGMTYLSLKEAGEALGIPAWKVSMQLTDRAKDACGYHFSYAQPVVEEKEEPRKPTVDDLLGGYDLVLIEKKWFRYFVGRGCMLVGKVVDEAMVAEADSYADIFLAKAVSELLEAGFLAAALDRRKEIGGCRFREAIDVIVDTSVDLVRIARVAVENCDSVDGVCNALLSDMAADEDNEIARKTRNAL